MPVTCKRDRWMIIGMIESQNVHLNGFCVYVVSRAQIAQSHQRRFRRWLSNRRLDVASAHHALVKQALSGWKNERLYLSLDTTLMWNCFCIVWVEVVYRGRTVSVAVGEWWRNPCSTVRLWTIQRVLRQAARILPDGVAIVLLADRGFADGKLMKYLKENRYTGIFGFGLNVRFSFGSLQQWHKVSSIQLQPGQAYFTPAVSIGKTKPYPNVYLAFAHDKQSDEDWMIVSDEPTTLQTFAQYRLRFQVEETFLDIKSNGFNLEATRLRDKLALSQLCGVIALTMLLLDLAGGASGRIGAASSGRCSLASRHELSQTGVELDSPGAITHQWKIQVYPFLSSSPDPQPAIVSHRQQDDALRREFSILSRFPAS